MAKKQRAKKDTKTPTSSKSTKRSVGTYVGERRAEAAKRGWTTRRANQKGKKKAA